MQNISDRLAWARKQKDLTQKQLAKLAGVAASTIGNVERGSSFTMRSILPISKVLGVNADWLASGQGQPHNIICAEPAAKAEHHTIQAVIDLMTSTDESGKLEILLKAQAAWEVREAHLRSIGQSPTRNATQRERHAELNKLNKGFSADWVSKLKSGDQ